MLRKNSWCEPLRVKELIRQFERILQLTEPDIINIHNLHSASWPIEMVKVARKHAPVAWTLHDCWSFLASYYPSHSPAPSSKNLSAIDRFWHSQQKEGQMNRLSAITPSRWMQEQAQASRWHNLEVETIPNCVTNEYFSEKDSPSAKQSLGCSLEIPVVLAIAGNLSEERKGSSILLEILKHMSRDKVQFLLVGDGFQHEKLASNVKSIGFIQDEITLRIIYAASDILLHPAPIDNLPNTVVEAMSCCTPVLAFNAGGIPEMVIPKKNGWIVKEHTAQSMISKLIEIIQSKDYLALRKTTKQAAEELLDPETAANRYQSHFEKAQRCKS